MAGSLLPLAKQIVLDNSANPGAGWKFYTYEPGTLTQKATYQDAALTTPNANPVVANSRGEVTMYGAGLYRIILKDSNDVTIWDRDSVGNDLADDSGAGQIGFIQSGTGAVARTAQDKMRESRSLDDFAGIDASGVDDSTSGVVAAFAWLSGGKRTLTGTPGAQYKVSASIPVAGNTIAFDGRECTIINAINSNPADPLFAITTASGNFVGLANFTVQYDTPADKGHTVSIIGNGSSPQVVALKNIKINYQVGNGKDHTGASMAAYAVYAYGVYTVYCDELYVQNGSGGLFFDTVQKVSLFRNVIDSCTNYGLWFDGCTSVEASGMNNITGCGQDAQAAVYFNACESFVFRDNRIKGGLGAEIMAGADASKNVTICGNHIEIYIANKRAIHLRSNTNSFSVEDNYIKFIGGNGPFLAGIEVTDTGIAAQSRGLLAIRRNKIVVGGADALTNGIVLTTASDQINGAIIESNSIGGDTVSATITNAINLACIGSFNVVRNNLLSGPNNTVTNGVVIGAGNTSAVVENNVPGQGTLTNALVNNGTGTRRYATGSLTPVLKGKTTAGSHTYSLQIASYRIVDDVVHFTATVDLATFDAAMSGFAAIELDSANTGLPKAKNTANQYSAASIASAVFDAPAGIIGLTAFVQPGTSEVWFSFMNDNAAATLATAAHVNVNFYVIVSGFYFAA